MDEIKVWRDANRKATTRSDDDHLTEPPINESFDLTLNDSVVVLGATNTPWMVDEAFLRAGRFDRVVHVGLPSEKDRESVLFVHIGSMKVKVPGGTRRLCESISKQTEFFSGADLSALCRAAAVRCLLENCEWVEERHFLQELNEGFSASSAASVGLVQLNEKWRP
jgi:SpoVK/Ycf46/Vps4 family AAA+-type ATPase